MSKKEEANEHRLEVIKKRYGKNALSKWGKLGGSPIIHDYARGLLVYRPGAKPSRGKKSK